MPTFTPPTAAGNLTYDPGRDSATNRLFRYFGSWAQGQTVWKDSEGVWHQSTHPYQGGAIHTTHNTTTGVTTVTGPDEGLATAEVVYDGGHEHEVTDAEAAELVAAGFALSGHVDSEEQKWVDYALTSEENKAWKGGDGFATQELATGSVATFADNIIGTVDDDGYYDLEFISRNAMVVMDSDGNITGQSYPGGVQPAFQHPTGGHWWWPLDVTLDGSGDTLDHVIVAALHIGPGAGFGEFLGNDLLALNFLGGVTSTTPVTLWGTDWQIGTIYNDTAFHYITGQGGGDLTTLRTYTVMARAPLGQLTNIAAWESWDGTGWSTNDPAFLARSLAGERVPGGSTITKSGDTWVLAVMPDSFSPAVNLYRSANPQGPWTSYASAVHPRHPQGVVTDGKTTGAPPNGARFVYYQPKFHEHLAPSAKNLVLTYNRNVFGNGFPQDLTLQPDDYHVSTYSPLFVYLPAPE